MIRQPPNSTLFPYPPLSRPPATQAAAFVEEHLGLERALKQRAHGIIERALLESVHRRHGYFPAGSDATASISTRAPRDRKSTRLNSSHLVISYAVFCLKKKK